MAGFSNVAGQSRCKSYPWRHPTDAEVCGRHGAKPREPHACFGGANPLRAKRPGDGRQRMMNRERRVPLRTERLWGSATQERGVGCSRCAARGIRRHSARHVRCSATPRWAKHGDPLLPGATVTRCCWRTTPRRCGGRSQRRCRSAAATSRPQPVAKKRSNSSARGCLPASSSST